MKQLIRDNVVYFSLFLLFLLIGGILLLNISTGDTILFFSERRSEGGDFFFKYATKLGEHILYIGCGIAFLFYRIRHSLLILFSGVAVLLVSLATKAFFAHPRPSLFFREEGIFDQINTIQGVELLGGYSSFPSGHTMSAFATYGLVALLLKRKFPWGFILFAFAFLVGFSRIYLVQHFLKDVYLGAILGTVIAAAIYLVSNRFPNNPNHWIDRSVRNLKRKPIA